MSVAGPPTQEQLGTMIVQSEVLGPLTVEPDAVTRFPTGLVGLPDCREFVLIPAHREGLFWLQSVEHGELAFVLVDPFLFFPGYEAELSATDLEELQATDGPEVAVLAIVTLPASRDEQPTANLQGPLALNLEARIAKQLVLETPEKFGVRVAFDLSAA